MSYTSKELKPYGVYVNGVEFARKRTGEQALAALAMGLLTRKIVLRGETPSVLVRKDGETVNLLAVTDDPLHPHAGVDYCYECKLKLCDVDGCAGGLVVYAGTAYCEWCKPKG